MANGTGAARLLTIAGLPPRPDLAGDARDYLRWTRRGRWLGVIAGLLLGTGLTSRTGSLGGLGLTLPWILTGYLLGDLAGLLIAARARHLDHEPRPSTPGKPVLLCVLLPAWARLAPWVVLTPVLCSTLLLLVPRPQATSRHSGSYFCGASVSWPALTGLFTVGCTALVGLVIAEVTLAGLARTPGPAADPAHARLRLVLRSMAARASAGGATALGLALLSGVGQALSDDLDTAHLCPAVPGGNTTAFSWAGSVTPWLQQASLGLAVAAVLIWLLSSRSLTRIHPGI